MSEVIFFSDPHLNKENDLEVVDSNLKQVVDFAVKRRIQKVFCLGDVFTNRKYISLFGSLIPFYSFLDYCEANGVTLYVIPGNHDKVDQDSDKSYLDVFQTHPAIRLAREVTYVTVSKKLVVVLLPFYPEEVAKGIIRKIGADIKSSKVSVGGAKIILGTHLSIDGAVNNDGSKVEGILDPNVFSSFHRVLVGHYHDRNVIGGKVVYIGSLMQRNFGEDANKGFVVVDEDGEIEYIKTDFPKFHKIEFDLPKDFKTYPVKKQVYVKLRSQGDRVRFIIKGSREDCMKINLEELDRAGIEYEIQSSTMVKNIEEATKETYTRFSKAVVLENFKTFVKENEISPDLVEVGKKYLKQQLGG